MAQPVLIIRILDALSLNNDANTKTYDTPAVQILATDEDGNEGQQSCHYRIFIDMLMYLASSTYPDILFAVHQCKQFIKNPKRCHEEAIKRIGRYPKATHDIGIIYKPSNTNQLGCYVDADFADCFTEEIIVLQYSVRT